MSTEYGVTRELGEKVYSASGFSSREGALLSVYESAFDDGNWRPRTLREKWWQIWRPTRHTDIEKFFLGEISESEFLGEEDE